MLTVLLGGARSGKSALAVELAGRSGSPVTFVATGAPADDEMAARIERHRAERPVGWTTIEEPIDLFSVLSQVPPDETIVVDCLTLWVANLVGAAFQDGTIDDQARRCASVAALRSGLVIVVSNEVGSGIVPFEPTTRRYRDLLGQVNAIFSTRANEAYLLVAGRVLRLDALEPIMGPEDDQ